MIRYVSVSFLCMANAYVCTHICVGWFFKLAALPLSYLQDLQLNIKIHALWEMLRSYRVRSLSLEMTCDGLFLVGLCKVEGLRGSRLKRRKVKHFYRTIWNKITIIIIILNTWCNFKCLLLFKKSPFKNARVHHNYELV